MSEGKQEQEGVFGGRGGRPGARQPREPSMHRELNRSDFSRFYINVTNEKVKLTAPPPPSQNPVSGELPHFLSSMTRHSGLEKMSLKEKIFQELGGGGEKKAPFFFSFEEKGCGVG